MKTKAHSTSKYVTEDGYAYITKRTLLSKAKNAGKKAAKEAMEEMGFVITIENGSVIKKHKNGVIEIISAI